MTIRRVQRCEFTVSDRPWLFADRNVDAIAENWRTAQEQNPKLFNGDVFVTDDWSIGDDLLRGQALRTKFASYLYWREVGFDGGATYEAFASTLVISADGGVMLGRSVAGTLNQGKFLTPGGLVDPRDMMACGGGIRLDLASAAERELHEETGLTGVSLRRDPGFIVAQQCPFLAVASVFRSDLASHELISRVEMHLAETSEPELVDVRFVHSMSDLEQLPATEFARLLAGAVLA